MFFWYCFLSSLIEMASDGDGLVSAIAVNSVVACLAAVFLVAGISMWPAEALPRAAKRDAGIKRVDYASDIVPVHTIHSHFLRRPPTNPLRLLLLVLWYPRGETLAVVGLDGLVALRSGEARAWFLCDCKCLRRTADVAHQYS